MEGNSYIVIYVRVVLSIQLCFRWLLCLPEVELVRHDNIIMGRKACMALIGRGRCDCVVGCRKGVWAVDTAGSSRARRMHPGMCALVENERAGGHRAKLARK
jgi:hypothetical protein